MKHLITFLLLGLIATSCKNQKPAELTEELKEQSTFDAELAKAYGADDYGMKKYVIAFLKRGPNRDQDSITRVELQRAHMDNISKMAEDGKLVLAGPFFGDGDLRGIYVFDVQSIEEAKNLTETDPAIQAGSLVMDLKEWYGSAALMGVSEAHKKIAKEGI